VRSFERSIIKIQGQSRQFDLFSILVIAESIEQLFSIAYTSCKQNQDAGNRFNVDCMLLRQVRQGGGDISSGQNYHIKYID
jgi:hypothetical protein